MSDKIKNITDVTFDQEVLKADTPVLVDFWADWCSPCKQLSPIIEDIAESYAGEVKICKINVDENPMSSMELNVKGQPTMILFVQGKERARLPGLMSKTRIADVIEKHLEV